MRIIGENLHIISPRFKEAVAERDSKYVQEVAVKQAEAGAWALDLNIGPQKKQGVEIMTWLVNAVQEVVDVPLSFDTTNLAAIEAGCQLAKTQPIINSTSAEEARLANVPPLAKKYNAKLIALTMGRSGIPIEADARVNIALETLIPRALELDIPVEDLILDPLALTVSGCQEYCPECIEAVRMLKFAWDPPPLISIGLSNVSNSVPDKLRPLIDRVYMVMLMGTGLDAAIANPLDEKLAEAIRIVEERDDSTPLGRLYLKLHDRVAAMEEPQSEDADMDDPEQADVWKTVQILLNKVIYADSYLELG
jgi:5-methyltetrahydrofolate corrinoid/iron sulfur protein methyltransferase